MSNGRLTRRQFLKGTALVAGTTILPTGLVRAQRRPTTWHGRERVTEIPSTCEMCFWRCGIIGEVKDGRLVKIKGNPLHPNNRGKICARGNAGLKTLYDPDRLKYPLMRVGKRGEAKWRRVSWNEALDYMVDKLKDIKSKYGPEAIAMFPHGVSSRLLKSVFASWGVVNFAVASFNHCKGPRDVAFKLTFGTSPGSPERLDLPNASMIVLIGSHLGENIHTGQVREFAEAIGRGAKIVVVDPRFSTAASKAHWWLPIRPGSDTALILAWINVLIEKDLYDKEFVNRYTYGFEELKKAIKPFTPEWAEKVTDIPASTIREIAVEMGIRKPSVLVHPGRHTVWYGNDVQRSRAIAILVALLGSWGKPGGYFLPTPLKKSKCPCPKQEKPSKDVCEASGKHIYPFHEEGVPSQCVVDATLTGKPYPIKAWITYGTNIIQSIPQPERTIKAIEKLDLLVAIDILPTDPSLYADVILPEATYLERYDLPFVVSNWTDPYVAIRQPVVKPLFQSKGPFWIAKEVSKRLGLKNCLPCNSEEEMIDKILEPLNISLGDLTNKGVMSFPGRPYDTSNLRFRTPTGKIELYSTKLAAKGFSPIPVFEPVDEPPKGYFRLIYGRSPVHSFTRTVNNEWLDEIYPENRVWLNEKAAEKMGIKDGDEVYLVNQDGVKEGPVKVFVTPGIRDDCVFIVHGFGQKNPMMRRAYNKGISDSFLMTKIKPDPITGTTGMRVNFVKIEKNGKLLEYTPEGYEERLKEMKAAHVTPTIKIQKPANVQPEQPQPQEEEEEEGC